MAVIYLSAKNYIDTAKSIKDKIKKIDQIIDALLEAQLIAASGSTIEEYTLDDGQTRIQTRYTNVNEVIKSINTYEALKVMYAQRITGHVMKLVDGSNFTGNRC